MSSFRPSNSAKLYASPEDMKSVGYRSLSLPSHSSRSQLRKSHSLRTPNGSGGQTTPTTQGAAGTAAASFKTTGATLANGGPPNGTAGPAVANGNQYAQPLKNGRSHSTAGLMREKKKKSGMTASSSASNLSGASGGGYGRGAGRCDGVWGGIDVTLEW